jgi:hypothetical protein
MQACSLRTDIPMCIILAAYIPMTVKSNFLFFIEINSTRNKFNFNICGLFNCNMNYISKV